MRAVNQASNKYCGPAVLSVMTGKSTDECAAILGAIRGKVEVEEVTIGDMMKACMKLRFRTDQVPTTKNASLFYTLSLLSKTPGLYMVFIKKHVIAIEVTEDGKLLFCDNHTKEPIEASASARLGAICLGCYKVSPKPEPVIISRDIDVRRDSFGRIQIKRLVMYEDPEDNVIENLGMLYSVTDEDVKFIGERLAQLSQDEKQEKENESD